MSAQLQTKPLEIKDAAQLVDRVIEVTKVDAIFGKPTEREGVTLITCSEQAVGLGGGIGPAKPTEQQKSTGGTEAIGGGAGGRGRPVAVIVLTPSGVTIKPILNLTRVITASLTFTGAFVWMIARMYRSTRQVQLKKLAIRTTGNK
jgi:uncharacterized spore protein YtfJ